MYCIETSIIFVCPVHNDDEIEGSGRESGDAREHHARNRPTRGSIGMSQFHTQRRRRQQPTTGMSRFYSPANLDRYRKLASGAIEEAEQHQLLEDLAEEMNAFRREAREAAVNVRSAFKESLGSQAAAQI